MVFDIVVVIVTVDVSAPYWHEGLAWQDSCGRSLRGSRASISKIGNDVKRQDHVCMTKTLYQSFLVFSCRDTAVSLCDKVGRECSSGQGPLSLLSGDEVCLFKRSFQPYFALARICNYLLHIIPSIRTRQQPYF